MLPPKPILLKFERNYFKFIQTTGIVTPIRSFGTGDDKILKDEGEEEKN